MFNLPPDDGYMPLLRNDINDTDTIDFDNDVSQLTSDYEAFRITANDLKSRLLRICFDLKDQDYLFDYNYDLILSI
jgi:hypothetical protein